MFNFALRRLSILSFGLAALGIAATAKGSVTFNLTGVSNASGNNLSAEAIFTVTGGTTLTIELTNDAPSAAMNGADVLDGLFFDIVGSDPVFSNGSVALTSGSSYVLMNNVPSSGNPLNDEWMFDNPVPILGSEYGMAAAGFPGFNPTTDTFTVVFGGGSTFASANDDYGLVPTAGIGVGSPTNVYVNNSVTFTFTLSSAISESDIQNVMVYYGSNGQTLVPEPATFAAIGLGALGLLRRRAKK